MNIHILQYFIFYYFIFLTHLYISYRVDMRAETTRTTPVSLAQHSYFNLNGHQEKNILNHWFMVNSTQYTELDANNVATGGFIRVRHYDLFNFLGKFTLSIKQVLVL